MIDQSTRPAGPVAAGPVAARPVAVDVRDLAVRLRTGRVLLSDVSLAIPPGAHVAIIGPNGSGKSTLLKVLCGHLASSAGAVAFDGRQASRLSRLEIARRVAFMPQADAADARLRVADYVGLGRIPHARSGTRETDAAVVNRELARFHLGDLRDRPLGGLSGGERQRASLARALAQEPGLLCLDEPTNALDPRARHALIDLVRGLSITVIAVLHDLPLVPDFADRVAVLNGGRLVAFAAPGDALSQDVIRSVFGMDIVPIRHPQTGRALLHLEIPPVPRAASGAGDGMQFGDSLS